MTLATDRLEDVALTRAALATPFSQTQPLVVRGPFRRAAVGVGDLLGAVAIVLCIPLVILAIGTPIAPACDCRYGSEGCSDTSARSQVRERRVALFVLFGKYGSREIKLHGDEYLIMREDEVLAVVETG